MSTMILCKKLSSWHQSIFLIHDSWQTSRVSFCDINILYIFLTKKHLSDNKKKEKSLTGSDDADPVAADELVREGLEDILGSRIIP